jgi:GNAT superfamily N-acetyltransferase
LVVVEHGDELVGCGYAQIRQSKQAHVQDKHAYVGFIYVTPAYRGKGINQRIMDNLFAWSESRGVNDIMLDVYFANESAIRAYQKAGFEPALVQMRFSQGSQQTGALVTDD